jgi:hypothetical protein
MMYVYDTLENK